MRALADSLPPRSAAAVIAAVLAAAVPPLRAAEVSDADKRIVQTVQRLSTFNYTAASQKTKDAIGRYLDATAGSEEYFTLVEKFSIAAQSGNLLKLATAPAGTEGGGAKSGQAVRLLLKLGQQREVVNALAGLSPGAAGALLESTAGVGTQEAVALVMASLTAPATPVEVRLRAVKALGLGAAGQKALLEAAKAGQLPEEVREAAGTALVTSTDEVVRTEAAAVFQMTARKPLPPVSELAKRAGSAEEGHGVFMTYCFTCHQVNGQGIDFGPALSEIGSKLAKEALYDSILHPGAAISFGYEGYEVKTRSGDIFTGIITTSTDTELSLKLPGGVVQKCLVSEVVSKTPLTVSLMTPGLETVMDETQLVNLVEYLAGLKKK